MCWAAIYQPETQLQGTLISTLKGSSKTLTYLLLSLQLAGEVVALVGSNVSRAVVDTVGLHVVWIESF